MRRQSPNFENAGIAKAETRRDEKARTSWSGHDETSHRTATISLWMDSVNNIVTGKSVLPAKIAGATSKSMWAAR
jgi:hypothetical protein